MHFLAWPALNAIDLSIRRNLVGQPLGPRKVQLCIRFAGHRCAHPPPRIGAGFGGLSGPAIEPIALRMVYEAARNVKIPVIGLGGIASGEDAAEFLIAGASAVQVGTATFWNPRAPLRIAKELGDFMRSNHVQSVRELVATLRLR